MVLVKAAPLCDWLLDIFSQLRKTALLDLSTFNFIKNTLISFNLNSTIFD